MNTSEGDLRYKATLSMKNKIKWLINDERNYRTRLLVSALVFGAIAFTFIIFGPLDLVIANGESFPFTYKDILSLVLVLGCMFAVVFTIITSFTKGKIFDLIICIAMSILIGGYIQGNILNINLGELTGDTIYWEQFTPLMLKNTLIWFCIIVIVFAIRYFLYKYWKVFYIFVPSLLIVIQLVALISIIPTSGDSSVPVTNQHSEIISREALTEVASEENIVYIILDRLDNSYIEEVISDDPGFFDELDGFTRFTNNMTKYAWTIPSVLEALTGHTYTGQQTLSQHYIEAYEKGKMLPAIKENGFDMRLYVDKGYAFQEFDQVREYASNIKETSVKLDNKIATKLLMQLSAFRYAPHVFKAGFWLYSGEFESALYNPPGSPRNWWADDVVMYQQIIEEPMYIGKNNKSFVFYHMFGPHTPLYMNENAEVVPPEHTSVMQQTKGGFHVIYEYLNQLKELGLYENSTIVITGDHGHNPDWYYGMGRLEKNPIVTGLFVKPAGSAGKPLEYNNAPVNTENLRATFIRASEGIPLDINKTDDVDADVTNLTYFEVPENSNRNRDFYWIMEDYEGTGKSVFEAFDVVGDAKDFSNWHWVKDIPLIM